MTTEFGPPIDVLYPKSRAVALVISSPHSGWIYPPGLLDALQLDPAELRRLEDGCVDGLFEGAAELGAPLLRARFARAYVDPNREPYELDPALFTGALPPHVNVGSNKARAGLGTIPSRLGGRPIYRTALGYDEAERRLRLAYWPYHHALQRLLAEAQARFGLALLLDCHSMPRLSTNGAGDGGPVVDFALGDRYGRSCAPPVVDAAEALLGRWGFSVARNRPYAGGHITACYGRPDAGVHALQIEIRRDLYMDERTLRPHAAMARIKQVIRALLAELASVTTTRLAPPLGPLVEQPPAP